jgi:inorganic pyrophosphatase
MSSVMKRGKNMHPWHDVPIGKKFPQEINAVVEIPKGSRNKYELDKKIGMIRLDRTIYSSVLYPGDYGFVPQTMWEDKDPMDILILNRFPSFPLVIMGARPIGLMKMVDEKESDDKIIAVPVSDPFYKTIKEISELPPHTKREIKHFFEIYKELQHKSVKVNKFMGRNYALSALKKAQKLYQKKYKKEKR